MRFTVITRRLLPGLLLALVLAATGCFRHVHSQPDTTESQEPDKILYEKSIEDIKNHRWDVARLTLQTLLNTYPDSDYLAKAKMAIADSYFQEGTTSALTHAELEYKDYITFFPNDPQVPFAQYRAAMCDFRRLELPDRDPTYARRAEREFQLLLKNYADSEYAKDGELKLIQVQEVLAEGQFRIGRFYFIREAWRASASRLVQLIQEYPNYSKRDEALWMLAQTYEKKTPVYWEPDPKEAAKYYAQIIREHPLSDYVPEAKKELTRLGAPIPEPDPVLLARAQTVKPVDVQLGDKRGLLGHIFGMFTGKPDTSSAAARLGPPPLEPPADETQLPPPVFRTGSGSSVSVQTVKELPQGSVVKTGEGKGKPGENAEGSKEKPEEEPPPPRKKKSFWRKLIPFW